MQANMLAWLLRQRVAADGKKQCYDDAFRDDANLVNLRCTGAERGAEESGIQPEDNGFVISLHYTKVHARLRYTTLYNTRCTAVVLQYFVRYSLTE